MRLFVLAVLGGIGCYAPNPQTGSPCADDRDCPASLVCSPATRTCERTAETAGVDAAATTVDAMGGCTTCEANDTAGGAVDVTAGGTFTGNALLATDDVGPNGCGGDGGRDLFYEVDLSAPEVYYFDTFGSSFDTVLRVYAKPCAMVGTGAGATSCVDDTCNGTRGHAAVALPEGQSCIVVDQRTAAETNGMVSLRVIRGGRNGMPLAAGVRTTTGDTCASADTIDPIDVDCDGPGSDGKDHAYFFTTCPGEALELDAAICPEPAWDPVLHVRRISDDAQIGCNDDSCGFGPAISNVTISGGALYFLFVDGFSADHCGPYSLETNLRP